jgi:hypothetical protein
VDEEDRMRSFALILTLSVAVMLSAATCSMAFLPTMWEKTYGGEQFETLSYVENTSDGGFIMVGTMIGSDTTSQDVWLVKINAHGDTTWTRHYGGPDDQTGEGVVETPEGGFLAVGSVEYEGTGLSDVFLICVDSEGDSLWANTYGYAGWDNAFGVTHAYEGGYVITGTADVYGTGSGDVFITKVDAGGNWQGNVIVGGPETDWAYRIRRTSDGGYIVVGGTRSYGYGSEDVYLLKFSGSRVLQWQETYGGTGWDSGYDVRETPDGGFIVAGRTPEGPGGNCAFLVKTDADGDSIWTGTYGSLGYDMAESIVIAADGNFVFAGVTDSWSLPSFDIYLQSVAPDGSPLEWRAYGGTGYDVGTCIQVTPDDGLVICGQYGSDTMGSQGYAMRTLGFSPRIWAVADITGDQGGQVRLCWFRSAYDEIESAYPIFEYSVWRRIDPLPLSGGAAPGIAGCDRGPVVLAGTEFPPGDWDYVATVPALGENEYCCVVPTLCDWSVANGMCWSVFFVAAQTSMPLTYFASPPDSGVSVDNLEPSPPAGLYMPAATQLAWDAAPEDDFDHFAVYGSETGDFGGAWFISETDVPAMDVSAVTYAYYHVTTLDHAGNESEPSSVENTFADVEGGAVPKAYALGRNRPNPFGSVTSIGFDMPAGGHVVLEVIDVTGRTVRTLVESDMPAGRHTVAWDGSDVSGAHVSPGIYFVRLRAGAFTATRKMLLLR